MSAEHIFELPGEADNVPDDNFGIYAFRLSLPNDVRLGLLPERDCKLLTTDLLRRAERLNLALSRSSILLGQIATEQAPHLRTSYSVTAQPSPEGVHATYLAQVISELGGGVDAVKAAAMVLRYTLDLSQPIYVGMTASQTFQERLRQHMSGATQFSGRLKELKVSWSDLKFIVRPLDVPRRAVLCAERATQAFLRPRISLA